MPLFSWKSWGFGYQNKIQLVLDSVFKSEDFYVKLFSQDINYWIVDKKRNFRVGPMSKNEFEKEASILRLKIAFDKE